MRRIPREIWVLIAAAFVIALGFGIVAPVLPLFARSFDVGLTAASAIVTVFALARMVFAPGGGWLIQRFGERRTYLAGLLIVALSTGAVAFADSYAQLLLFRGLGGIGSVMFTVSSIGLMARLAPPDLRGRTSSAYGTAFLLGTIIGPVLSSLLVGFGYRLPFLIYAVALLVATAVVAVFLSGTRLREQDAETGDVALLSFREAWADSAYRALLASSFANGWTNFGVRIALLPLMAAAVPTIGAPMAGLALTVFALGNAVTQQATGRFVDERGRRPAVIVGLLLSGVATMVLGWSTSIPVFLGLSLLAGMGAAFVAPAQQATLADVIGRNRRGGPAVAAMSMTADSGSIVGTLATGWVADQLGFGWAFALTGLVMVAAVVPWLRAREPMVRSERY